MQRRRLGSSGLEVSVLSFGLMTFGGNGMFAAVGNTETDEARRLIDISLDAGVNLLDTADIYSNGRSEEILGEALSKEKRKDVLIATKAFAQMGKGVHDLGLSRRHLIDACEASLKRMRTDWIDLYQVHNFDGAVPLDETLRALDDLVRAGKVRYIGCSNYSGWQLTKALGISERRGLERYISQQIQYSLLVRDVEDEMLPAGIDQGVGALIWSPLASGYLSGKFRGGEVKGTRITEARRLHAWDTPIAHAVVEALADIAGAAPGRSMAQAALNWLLRRPGVTSVIVGARNEAQLRDNLAATSWSLSDAEMVRLDAASQTPVRYPAGQQQFFGMGRNPVLFPRHNEKSVQFPRDKG